MAIIGIGGRRWIQGAYGEVDWVRNLRDAGEATLTAARRTEAVRAAELNKGEAAAFFAEILTQYLQQAPALVRSILPMVLGVKDAVRDPQAAAERHPVFEIWAR